MVDIDSMMKNNLFTLMQTSSGILQSYCRNTLIHTDGLIYQEPYILPDTSSNKSIQFEKPTNSFNNRLTNYLNLYPNPAKDYITLEYHLPNGSTNMITEVLNVTGMHLEVFRLNHLKGQKIIDLRTYQSGTYIIRLWANDKVLQSKKFTKY